MTKPRGIMSSVRSRSCPVLLALALLAAGCAPTAPVPSGGGETAPMPGRARVRGDVVATSPLPAAAVLDRAAQALRKMGFTSIDRSDITGSLEAHNNDRTEASWADCPRITLRDPFAEAFRSRPAEASGFRTVVTVTTARGVDGGTRLGVRVLNIGTYLNGFTNTPEEAACRSTGVLERELATAIGGTA